MTPQVLVLTGRSGALVAAGRIHRLPEVSRVLSVSEVEGWL